ncbi:hypothetical protein, partial [Microbacterium sp. NPDC056569]|uniref:hypothetical protein n=1 Tax=Microbacterium sp. NPDC056569 TaxID=3345867 RepID=UPI00366DB4F6
AGGLFLGLMVGGIAALLVTRARSGPTLAYRRDRRHQHDGNDAALWAGAAEPSADSEPSPLRRSDDLEPAPVAAHGGAESAFDQAPVLARKMRS